MKQETKDMIVQMVEEVPNFTAVRKMFGIPRATFMAARKADPKFDEELKAAREDGYEMMEAEAHSRAVTGWVEPIFYRGEMVIGPDGKPTGIRKKSDSLLKFLLTHCNPKKFNPGSKVSIAGDDKVKFVFNVTHD